MTFYKNEQGEGASLAGFPGVTLYGASREPCPVCGHPTGDCAGTTPPPKTLIGMSPMETLKDSQTFYLEHDILEEREIVAGQMTKIIKYRAGTSIPVSEAKKLGLM